MPRGSTTPPSRIAWRRASECRWTLPSPPGPVRPRARRRAQAAGAAAQAPAAEPAWQASTRSPMMPRPGRRQHTGPAAREQSRPMGRVEDPRPSGRRELKAVTRRYMLPPGGAHTSGNSAQIAKTDPGGRGTVIADGEYSRHRNRQPSHVGLAAAVCASSTDMRDRKSRPPSVRGTHSRTWTTGVVWRCRPKGTPEAPGRLSM